MKEEPLPLEAYIERYNSILNNFAENDDPSDPYSMVIDINGTLCKVNSARLKSALDEIGLDKAKLIKAQKKSIEDPESTINHACGFKYNFHYVVGIETPHGTLILDAYLPEDLRRPILEEHYMQETYSNPENGELIIVDAE